MWFSFVSGHLRPRRISVVVFFLRWFAAPSKETTPFPHVPPRSALLFNTPPTIDANFWLVVVSPHQMAAIYGQGSSTPAFCCLLDCATWASLAVANLSRSMLQGAITFFRSDLVRIPTRNLYAVTEHLLTRRNFLFLNSLKGFQRSLGQRAHIFSSSANYLKTQLPDLWRSLPFARLNALQPAVTYSHNLSDPTTLNSQFIRPKWL